MGRVTLRPVTSMMKRRSLSLKSIRASRLVNPVQQSTGRRVAGIGLALLLSAGSADAHGFGQRYDLPLPLSFYLFGTAAAVVLSFVVVGIFARHAPGTRSYPRC